MRVRPRLVLLALAGSLVTAALPAAADDDDTTLTGRLEVVHGDDFAAGRAAHTYTLRAHDGTVTALRFADEGPHQLGGREVSVHGHRHGTTLDVAAAGDAQPVGGSASSAAAGGPVRFGVVLLQFADKDLPVTQAQVSDLVFGTGRSVTGFYADNSYGALPLSGTVFPVVRISATSTDVCNNRSWGDEARALEAANGFVESDFTQVAHIMPRSTCNFLGTSELPGKYTWDITDGVDGTEASQRAFRGLVAHELGHNLNAYHGASLACTDNRGNPVVLSGKCTKSEYGDPFTVMGDHRAERTFNAFQKGRVSWYAPSQGRAEWLPTSATRTVTSTATVDLGALDGTTPQVVRVPRPGSRTGEYYYLELRTGGGYDGAQPDGAPAVGGVTIRLAPDYATGISTSLLDLTPGSPGGFADGQLAPGMTWTEGTGVTFKNTTPTGATSATIVITVATASKGGKG